MAIANNSYPSVILMFLNVLLLTGVSLICIFFLHGANFSKNFVENSTKISRNFHVHLATEKLHIHCVSIKSSPILFLR